MAIPQFRILIILLAGLTLLRPAFELARVVRAEQLVVEDTHAIVVLLQFLNAGGGAAMALALVWHAAALPAARALAVLAVLWPATIGGVVTLQNPVLERLATIFQISCALFVIAAFLRFSAVFPRNADAVVENGGGLLGKLTARVRSASRRSQVVWAVPAIVTAAALTTFAVPRGDTRAAVEFLIGAVVAVLVPIALYAGALNLRSSYTAASLDERKRLFWLFEGLLVFAFGFFILPFLLLPLLILADQTGFAPIGGESFHAILQNLTMLIALSCLALAMFYDGAVDPRMVVRRTTVYGALTIVTVLAFAVVENLLAQVFSGVASHWISVGAAALCGLPVHNWLQSRFAPLTREPGPAHEKQKLV